MLDPNDPRAIAIRYGLPENLAAYMPRYINVESGGNPNAQTGSYSGLLQMGPEEQRQYGGKGVEQGVQMYVNRARAFQQQNGRMPDPTELYLMNQQGPGGLANHMANPGGAAWKNMFATGEGQSRGALWAKAAIWGNIPNDKKAALGLTPSPNKVGLNNPEFLRDVQSGALDKVSSNNFMDVWRNKIERTPIPPRPPGDIPNTQTAQAAPGKPLGDTMTGGPTVTPTQAFSPTPTAQQAPAQQAITAATTPKQAASPAQPEIPTRVYPGQQSTNYPDQRLPPSVGTGTGTVPLPYQRPAGAGPAVPADQKPASARAPAAAPSSTAPPAAAGSGLGNQMPVAGGYIDPNTGHQIINPSGSGETGMGVTRDIGPAVPARQAPAQTGAGNRNTPSGKPVRPPPTGPVPPAPDAAGRLAKPENMPAPEQTLKTLDASRQKPNTLTSVYGSQTPPTNPAQGATFRDIANAPPAFGGPKGSTLTDLPLPPYNVGGPGGTPLPPPRPNFGPDSGAPVARNYLRPGPAATPQEQAQQDAARATEQRYAAAQGPGPATAGPPPAPQPPGPPGLGDRLGAAIGQFSTAPYSPGFLRQTGPAATPAEQATRDQSRAAELARSSGPPGGSPAFALPQGSPAGPPRNADQFGGPGTPPGLAKAMMDAVSGGYKPGFLDQTGPAATPQEQTMRGQGQAATAGLPFVQPPSPPPPSAGAPGQPGMPPGPQNQSMLPPWQQQQQLPLSPFYSQGLPGQGWPNWQNFDTSFSGGNMGDFGGFGGGGGFAGSEGFAFTPG